MAHSLVGKLAPQFVAKAACGKEILEDFSLRDYIGRYVLFFFYPLDFTFVCPTELHAFQERLADFRQREAEVIACSIDSIFSHLAWLRQTREEGGIEGVQYPIVSDIHKSIAREYRVLNEEEGIAFRGLFLIDKQGVVRHMLVNDLPIGRSVEEALRTLDALIFHEKHGDVCPANWQVGEKSLKPTLQGVVDYFS